MDTQIITILTVFAMAAPVAWAVDKPEEGVSTPNEFAEQSSRGLIGEQKTAWITKMRTQLPIAQRDIGPFGMAQDTDAKPIERKQVKKRKPGAFLEAIAAIKVNAVLPSEKKFITGSREFKAGDRFPIIRAQRQFNIEIVSVQSGSILFKNVDTKKLVRRNLNTLPQGMTRNAGLQSVPGVVPLNRKDTTPLNLDHNDVQPLE
ncbi:MAG: hypothetical protein KJO21_01390 [Verrucomicrobiae bacterium]|nr:hypothetical protein [Verrucomicrobiae bacterium]NNJ42188.1 hypothetical protein [Akkermansiaceae bacterium]